MREAVRRLPDCGSRSPVRVVVRGEAISSFLKSHRGFEIEPASNLVAGDVVDESGAMLILPDRYGTDGLFAVRVRRVR